MSEWAAHFRAPIVLFGYNCAANVHHRNPLKELPRFWASLCTTPWSPELGNSKIQVLHLVSLRNQKAILSLPQLYRSCTEPELGCMMCDFKTGSPSLSAGFSRAI